MTSRFSIDELKRNRRRVALIVAALMIGGNSMSFGSFFAHDHNRAEREQSARAAAEEARIEAAQEAADARREAAQEVADARREAAQDAADARAEAIEQARDALQAAEQARQAARDALDAAAKTGDLLTR